ncbi:type II secretion system protein GspM [Vibrio aestuarianus]|uniref:Type II secretion system protein M n=1 Tax=Vibrio aestuarianus TaxID=28171 RepID=A0A9X4IX11_9VIBR|nr:type II secretion system protein GspM [Vibrio aestuarianus]MDE1235426.1 type II secretion system protein M [Vibrio aestuarianus]MDE1246320.1 type II secretion system protein M [Vibrio aestuarianus]MDE1346678.1 type II secretion system protein M [Vibrio aestuarianus]NGZ63423.1 type II secretion system protein M [Vibrio aestuarianus subsp. cardii]
MNWQDLNNKFSKLSQREKVLIALCGLVVCVLLIFSVLLEPTLKSITANKLQLQSLEQSNQRIQGDILLLTAKLNKDPNKEIDIEFKQLLAQSQELSLELSSVVDSLITPAQMAELLESVLASSQNLKLVSLESLSAETIADNSKTSEYSGYYVHPVRLEFTGEYFAILNYLASLESLPMKYYWRHFQYSVEDYPQARVIMEVYTLGVRQEFIGG